MTKKIKILAILVRYFEICLLNCQHFNNFTDFVKEVDFENKG